MITQVPGLWIRGWQCPEAAPIIEPMADQSLWLPPGLDGENRSDLDDLLAAQAGAVSLVQLDGFGVTRDAARWECTSGRWQSPHRGVYVAFTGPLGQESQVRAGLLRCGTGATASHETSAELHGLLDIDPDRPVHVTIPASRRVRGAVEGIVVHHAHRLDATRHPSFSLPRTRIEATVLDLVDVARSPSRAEAWIVTACQRRLTTPVRLATHLAERKKIRWRPMAEAMLLDVSAGAHSMLETHHLRAVERAHGLPSGHRQRRVAGARVIWIDVDYDPLRVRVELDGRVGHDGEGAFRDRRRDNRGVVDGRATLRYGHAEIFGTPCDVAAEQANVLRAHGWSGTPMRCGPTCSLR